MSKQDTCTKCGRVGHTASSCPRYIGPAAKVVVEPHDEHDRMVRCCDCKGSQGSNGNYRCPRYVPSMASVMQHCEKFRGNA